MYFILNLTFQYSKTSRYTASRCADLGDTGFGIGSKNTWDTRIYADFRGFLIKIHVKSAYLKHLEDFAWMSLTSFYQPHDAQFSKNQKPRNSRSYCTPCSRGHGASSSECWEGRFSMKSISKNLMKSLFEILRSPIKSIFRRPCWACVVFVQSWKDGKSKQMHHLRRNIETKDCTSFPPRLVALAIE